MSGGRVAASVEGGSGGGQLHGLGAVFGPHPASLDGAAEGILEEGADAAVVVAAPALAAIVAVVGPDLGQHGLAVTGDELGVVVLPPIVGSDGLGEGDPDGGDGPWIGERGHDQAPLLWV